MGWGSGSTIAAEVWGAIAPLLEGQPPEKIRAVARELVLVFERGDCDTLEEVNGPIGYEACARRLESGGAPERPELFETFDDGEAVHVWNGELWEYKGQSPDF